MSEKVRWTTRQNKDETISIYRDGEFIVAMEDKIENHRLVLRFQRDLDRLAEINKVLTEALERIADIPNKVSIDGQAGLMMRVANHALKAVTKAKKSYETHGVKETDK